MKILKSQTLASCNTEDVMESRASVSNFTSPPMVLVTSPYVSHSLTHTHTHAHAHAYTPTRAHKPHTHSHMFTYFSKPLLTKPLMPPFGSIFFLCLSFHTHTHTRTYTHTRLLMMMTVGNRLKSTIMRPWKFSSLRLWRVATLRMSRSWNLVCQFPTLHHLQWSWSSHSMWPIHSSYFSNLLLTGLSMLPFYLVHTLASAYLVAQTQHTRVLLIVLSP